MSNEDQARPKGEILFYQTEEDDTKVEVRIEKDTVWMTQASLAELYGTTPQNITMHLRNIFEEGELDEASTCKDYLQVQMEWLCQALQDNYLQIMKNNF